MLVCTHRKRYVIMYASVSLESEMEDSLATSSSSSAFSSSEESNKSLRARESLRGGLSRSSSLRVTRTRAAQRRAGEGLWGDVCGS